MDGMNRRLVRVPAGAQECLESGGIVVMAPGRRARGHEQFTGTSLSYSAATV